MVDHKASDLLWDVLAGAYRRLGFDQLDDQVFAQLVGARIIEPVSKLDTIRVLTELGLAAPHRNTIANCLRRCVERDYRGRVATACWAHVQASGPVALVMYDLTTLHFEVTDEDRLRKVGMSKEHRIDPQVTVGLLVAAAGFPLEIALFEGNKAETTTLVPVIDAFRARHRITELVVVADAGMLSAANLNAIEDAGCRFIVGSRQSRVPYDLADHFQAHGTHTPDGGTIETSRDMGTGKDKRARRVVYHYSAARRRTGGPRDQRPDRQGREGRRRHPADRPGPVRQRHHRLEREEGRGELAGHRAGPHLHRLQGILSEFCYLVPQGSGSPRRRV